MNFRKKSNEVNDRIKKRWHFLPMFFILSLMAQNLWSQMATEVTVRFANPTFNCQTGEYCVDVEYQADQPDEILYGMNVRFFYDDEVLEFIEFNDFQGGYDAYFPNPPDVNVGGAGSGQILFDFPNPNAAVFVNGAMILADPNAPDIVLPTAGWVKIYSMCFNVVDPMPDVNNFCPTLVWDLEEPPGSGGFLTGDDGVVILLVDETGMQISKAADEAVEQFNWQYDGVPGLPYGMPIENNCISIASSIQLSVNFTDNDVCGASNGSIYVCGLDAGSYYEVDYTRDGVAQTTIAQDADGAGCILIDNLDAATYDNIVVTDTTSGCLGIDPSGPYVVTDPGGPVLSNITPSNPTSCGGMDGTITICGLEATESYDVDYTRNAIGQPTLSVIADGAGCVIIANLDAATYDDIEVTETVSGCSSDDDGGPYTLTDPAGPNVVIMASDPSQCGSQDGTIEICGLQPSTEHDIDYTLDGSGESTTQTSDGDGCVLLVNLDEGVYANFVVTDNVTGCASSDAGPYTLSDPDGPTIGTISASDPTSCGGSDGSIEICGLTALNTYRVDYWRNGVGVSTPILQANVSGCITITGLDAATYSSLEIIDLSTSCSTSDLGGPYTLIDPNGPVLGTISGVDPSTCGASDGYIRICGLSTGLSYSVDYTRNGANQNTGALVADIDGCIEVGGLDAATYDAIEVTVISTGCTSIDNGGPYTLIDPNGPVLGTITGVDPSTCGASDGYIRICGLSTGLSYSVDYTRNGVSQNSGGLVADIDGCIEVGGLDAATYGAIEVTVISTGCTSVDNGGPYTLVDPNGPVLGSIDGVDPSSCGGSDGYIRICGLSTGLSYSVDYTRNGVNQNSGALVADIDGCIEVSSLNAATYNNLEVTAIVSGCTSIDNGGPYILNDPNGPQLGNIFAVNPSSCGASDAYIRVCGLSTGLSYSVDYTRNGVSQNSGALVADIDGCIQIDGLDAATYSALEVTDISSGCSTQDNGGPYLIVDPNGPTLGSISGIDPTTCNGTDGRLRICGLEVGQSYSVEYTRNGSPFTAPGLVGDIDGCIEIGGLDPATYDIVEVVQLSTGCSSIDNGGPYTLSNPSGPDATLGQVSNPSECQATDGSIEICGLDANVNYQITFDYNGSAQNRSVTSGVDGCIVVAGLSAGSYTNFVLTDIQSGCESAGLTGVTLVDNCGGTIIGDFVFHDKDGDGIQDIGEEGIADITVRLYNLAGIIIDQTVTDVNGYYVFSDFAPGDYYLKFYFDDQTYRVSPANVGANDAIDSDVDDSNGENTTAVITIGDAEVETNWDLGLFKCIPVGDFVWFDLNANGKQDTPENGINGVRVYLYDSNDQLVGQRRTGPDPNSASGDGYYKFCVDPGTYYIVFERPGFLAASEAFVGTNKEKDSDITHSLVMYSSDMFTVFSGDMKCDIDGGFHSKATMGDNVWYDENVNGIQDAGEQPVEGVVVRAYDRNGVMFWEDVSDQKGQFYMDGLSRGEYYLKFDPPAGYTFTTPDVGINDGLDSDVDGSNGDRTTALYHVDPGEHEPDVDAGLVSGFLPTELLDFNAVLRGQKVDVTWQTAIEINNDYFEIERRHEDEAAFSSIGRVKAAGTVYSIQDYGYQDFEIEKSGIYYYRLHQVDTDGTDVYSEIRVVEVKHGNNNASVFPNPASGVIHLSMNLEEDKVVLIEIQDEWGRTLSKMTQEFELNAGDNMQTIQIDELPSGVYTMRVKAGDYTQLLRFTKVK